MHNAPTNQTIQGSFVKAAQKTTIAPKTARDTVAEPVEEIFIVNPGNKDRRA
jgi:hypothetical protein